MISGRLYELAFAYKKTKLWENLWDSEMFAIKLADGRLGYVSIMGAARSHYALGVYIGSKGLDSFRTMAKADQFGMNYFEFQEQLMQQDCLQCSYEGKDDLSPEELEEVRAYARTHKIRLTGKNAYPQFIKYLPNRCPWHLQTREEQEILCEALEAAIALAGLMEGNVPGDLGFQEIGDWETEIPLLEQKEGKYIINKTVTPPEAPRELPAPLAVNEIGIAKLKKQKKSGSWECEIIRIPEPVRNETDHDQPYEEEIPFFPIFLIAVNSETRYILSSAPVKDYEENPEELLNLFIEALLRQKICPKEIVVRDERTYKFAEDICRKLHIVLTMDDYLEALEEAEDILLERMDMSEEEEMEEFLTAMDTLLETEDGRLEQLPEEAKNQLYMLMEHELFPQEVKERMERALKGESQALKGEGAAGNGKKTAVKSPESKIRQMTPAQSYVISVSLGSGCYRHIQISGSSTLADLHETIQDAFAFDDDHLYAFFMDNHCWSHKDCYYAEGAGEGGRHTGKCRLGQMNLFQGKQFKYLFDFGDEWTFQCKVLRILDGYVSETSVIRSKGEPPSQYGDWDDDWDDD